MFARRSAEIADKCIHARRPLLPVSGKPQFVLQGGHEDSGRPLVISAPGLPPLLQNPLPKGLLRGGTPLPKR